MGDRAIKNWSNGLRRTWRRTIRNVGRNYFGSPEDTRATSKTPLNRLVGPTLPRLLSTENPSPFLEPPTYPSARAVPLPRASRADRAAVSRAARFRVRHGVVT